MVGALGAVFVIIPFLGWLISVLIAVVAGVLAVIELVLVITDPEGRRMGDKLAGTKVIEAAE